MVETRQEQQSTEEERDTRSRSLLAHCSLLIASLCGFVTVFGLAHLLLIHITKPSGYVFFGTVAVVPLVIFAVVYVLVADRRAALMRFGFGALMCVCAIPAIYLARFAPEASRQTVRNLLGLPFLILALIGPAPLRSLRSRSQHKGA